MNAGRIRRAPRRRGAGVLICLFASLVQATPVRADDFLAPPEPSAYRMEDFRAPVPATLKGARVLTTGEAFALFTAKTAAFVDVLPHAPKPANLPAGVVWRDKIRMDIPGSLWLPDVGYGAIAQQTMDYFKRGLEKASGGDLNKPLVFYCLKDCWMSWNAARRALEIGYRQVLWYPDGTDGWEAEGHRTEQRAPEPRP
ncbi:MAG: PQQ-dependent catabolism-associated CXXCW motif protein [Hyphomicrobiales bacterium]|nr:PQQ-dependent catabolism-associated CXXCW motif protein [Hyphomicrobiales bacterium]